MAAWVTQAVNQPKRYWVEADVEDDGNRSRSRLSCQYARGAGRYGDYGNLATNQIGRQSGKSIVVTLCPAIFNQDIAALDVTRFAQALVKGGQTERIGFSRSGADVPNDRLRRLLRPRCERRSGCAAEQHDELAPFQMTRLHLQLLSRTLTSIRY
jgi:hypothetical protein